MATGKPPFFEVQSYMYTIPVLILFFILSIVQLGVPEAAIFKVGKYQEHPDIPECLSIDAKSFLLGSETTVLHLLEVYEWAESKALRFL